ncbi:hypothetical protein SDC9_156088 [bioreactor metagenome]|uniref:Uncharacterized protein n=1 Tax=bioreactor metagenome TaxID=1076179 RepID=A0A645F8K1_9ZZZZ
MFAENKRGAVCPRGGDKRVSVVVFADDGYVQRAGCRLPAVDDHVARRRIQQRDVANIFAPAGREDIAKEKRLHAFCSRLSEKLTMVSQSDA